MIFRYRDKVTFDVCVVASYRMIACVFIRTLRLANTNNERRMSDARDLGRGVVRVRVRFVLSLSVVRQLTTTGFEEFHVLIRT